MYQNNTTETPESIAIQKEILSKMIQGTVYETSFNLIGFSDAAENLDSNVPADITALANNIKQCIEYMMNDTEDMRQVGRLLLLSSIPVIENAYYYKYSNSSYKADPNKWFFNNGIRILPDADEWINWTNLTGFPKYEFSRNENGGIIKVAELALKNANDYTTEMFNNINNLNNSASLTKSDVIKMAKISFKALRGWIGCKENLEIIQSGAKTIKTSEETRIGTSITNPDDTSRTIFEKIPTNNFDSLVYNSSYNGHPTHSSLPSYWPGDGTLNGGDKQNVNLEFALQTSYTPGVYVTGTLDPYNARQGRYQQPHSSGGNGTILYIPQIQTSLTHGWVMPESVWNPPDYSHNAVYTTPQINTLGFTTSDYNHNKLNLYNLFTLDASNAYVTGTISNTNLPKVGKYEDTVDRVFALKAAKAIEDWVQPGILPAKTQELIQDKGDDTEVDITTPEQTATFSPEWDPNVKYWDSLYLYNTNM